MKRKLNSATPLSILMNIILLINVVIVLYPVLFTISSSFSLNNSLGASSVIPFTDETDRYIKWDCEECDGRGFKEEITASKTSFQNKYVRTGNANKVVYKFSMNRYNPK